ncbi:glycoside hydrolase family 16 protein [Pseudonocardia parietis]|uniref:GH16 domain-containing protein n=1 Tax=Pseudonocardia parietis TaxID=570936 RepID=A0ABS4VKZ8_9PSEU|nr:glycoside hydrolase family 16 protein [Pseudonocardia parietis]MBP2364591.1 hypothetical protein [Pseudonocardia parietis]
MQRKTSAAADRIDPRDLIERVAAEHSSPSVPSPRAGRSASAAVPATTLLQGAVTASGRHRRVWTDDDTGAAAADSPTGGVGRADRASDGTATEVRVTTTALPAGDASPWAPRPPAGSFPPPDDDGVPETSGTTIAGLHEDDAEPAGDDPVAEPAGGGSVVEIDRAGSPRRSAVRRFAPLGVGAAALLAATMVVTLLQPGTEDPSLSTTLVDASRRSVSEGVGAATSGIGDGGGSRLADAAGGASGQIGPAIAAAEAAERRDEERSSRATSDTQDGSSGSGSGATSGSESGPGSGEGSAPAAGGGGVAEAAQVAGQGVQAALAKGWQAIGGDEFTGSSLGENWSAYDGPGHDGNGRRTPDAVSVENDNLVIRGDSEGNTGGIAWGEPQKYGKWEMRAKFPAGDKQYHPVLLLWPSEVSWPEGGEVDFAETTSASDDVSFFLHYGSDNSQKDAKKALDITQWNNYAVEWTPDAIIGYINGEEWFRSEDPNTLPPGPMHATVQLDYFPEGGSPEPSEMHVAWMRQYS